jgi:hypothetical protein
VAAIVPVLSSVRTCSTQALGEEAVNLLFAKHRLNRDRRSLVFVVSFDIQVKLSDVKVVFSIGALAFEGNLPASIFHMQLIKNDIASWSATSEIVAVLHTNAGHVTLHDTAYNADRNIATGNPYKDLIFDLEHL